MSDDLKSLYQEIILQHARTPKNFGDLPTATHHGLGHNPLCGDQISLHLRLENGYVAECAFTGKGCAIAMASCSLLTDAIRGLTPAQAEDTINYVQQSCMGQDLPPPAALDEDTVLRLGALSGVRTYPVRVKCATLAWHTLHQALNGSDTAKTE